MATGKNPPNPTGKGPSVTAQGGKGPIVGNHTKVGSKVVPFSLNKGSNRQGKVSSKGVQPGRGK